jgi:hypothetical protein
VIDTGEKVDRSKKDQKALTNPLGRGATRGGDE